MKRHFVLLIPPLVLQLLLAAQQVSTVQKGLARRQETLPIPPSTTVYEPYFNEGRGYWERNHLVYVWHTWPERSAWCLWPVERHGRRASGLFTRWRTRVVFLLSAEVVRPGAVARTAQEIPSVFQQGRVGSDRIPLRWHLAAFTPRWCLL